MNEQAEGLGALSRGSLRSAGCCCRTLRRASARWPRISPSMAQMAAMRASASLAIGAFPAWAISWSRRHQCAPAEGKLYSTNRSQRPISSVAVDLQHTCLFFEMLNREVALAVRRIDVGHGGAVPPQGRSSLA